MRDKKIKVVSYILTTIIVAVILFAFYSLGQYRFIKFGDREAYSFAEAFFYGIGTRCFNIDAKSVRYVTHRSGFTLFSLEPVIGQPLAYRKVIEFQTGICQGY